VADTTYIVLRKLNELGGWGLENLAVEASSAETAIRKSEPSEGTYVAVPARSWKPVQVRTETQTVIRLDTPPAE
jgi:hypothetical protein